MIRPLPSSLPFASIARWTAAAFALLLVAQPAPALAGPPEAAEIEEPPAAPPSSKKAKKKAKKAKKEPFKGRAKKKGALAKKDRPRAGKGADSKKSGPRKPGAAKAKASPESAEGKRAKKKRKAKGSDAGLAEKASGGAGTRKAAREAKRVAARTESGRRRGADVRKAVEAPKRPCASEVVSLDRGGLEADSYPLVDCEGRVLDEARVRLSVLARPWGTPKPGAKSAEPAPSGSAELAPGVRLLDPGLVLRLHGIARKFRGKNVSLVSGYRPQSGGSLHQDGRALDLRVSGVDNAELVAFCKTLKDTGCGFYPNSSFVHVDVRPTGSGSVTWIDASGPGEAPRYVTQWPPPAEAPAPEPSPAIDPAPKASNEAPAAAASPGAGKKLLDAKPGEKGTAEKAEDGRGAKEAKEAKEVEEAEKAPEQDAASKRPAPRPGVDADAPGDDEPEAEIAEEDTEEEARDAEDARAPAEKAPEAKAPETAKAPGPKRR